jgi:glycosyltransferase involved in cell wall biosynthesis
MRPRLLITAYHYDRLYSMESRLAWQRAQSASVEYDVTVLCSAAESCNAESAANVRTVVVPLTRLEKALMSTPATYYVGYRRWQHRLFHAAQRLEAEAPFALVHQVSFCGYRAPGDCWRLKAPFVWGPVGGTASFPARFLGQLDFVAAAREVVRNALNYWQLRHDPRVHRTAERSNTVLAANRRVATDLAQCLGVNASVLLETGIEGIRQSPRPPRDVSMPLRILWAGRLRAWKGLPLLLKALASLPGTCRYTLRILGQGKCESRWRRLADRLGIGPHIEWAGWSPDHRNQLPHYDWADAFAFTSLRDTSGTGLLEALAAGAPIIGLDHQGAADLMTPECAIAIPVTSPAKAIDGFRDAIERLTRDAELHSSLSAGAVRRAYDYSWVKQWDFLQSVYAAALASTTKSSPCMKSNEIDPNRRTENSADSSSRIPGLVEALC